ncbi:MAG TPA: endospore germination permease [Clostridiales bacterium]|nr:endospore germination permease [Clostridiales bacterium]
MQKHTQGLSSFQVTVLVSLGAIGVAVLYVPQTAAKNAGIDSPFIMLAAGIIAMFFTGIIIILGNRFPNMTMIEYSRVILGKYLGWLFGAVFVLYTLITTAYITRVFGDAMKVLLLPRTPLEIVMISMLLLCAYCIHGGISTIAKVCEIFLLPVIAVIGTTIVFNLQDVQMFRFREMFSNGIKPLITSLPVIFVAYLGFEILYFILPFLKTREKSLLYGMAGLILPIFVYTGLVFIAVGTSGDTIALLVYPTIHLARRIGSAISFIERFDIFFITFWILAVFTTLVIFIYMSVLSATRLLNLRNYKPFLFILLPVYYIIAIIPQNIAQIEFLGQFATYGGIFVVSSSIPLLVISIIRKKGGRNNVQKN